MENIIKNRKPLVSIIILNWNGIKFLSDCFSAIEKQTYPNLETIFVDNGSTDDSVFFIKKNFPKVIILENEINLGFAQGNNEGILKANGKYVFLLNNDTKMNEKCIENLLEVAERDNTIGMFAPKILSIKNEKLIDSIGLNIYPDGLARGAFRNNIDNGQYNNNKDIFFPSGCAALYRKEMLDEIGLLDKIFFAYCEDTDLGIRARLSGWEAQSVPSAIVYHWYSGTTGAYSETKAFLVERNHFFVAIKNFPIRLLVLLPFYTIKRYLYTIYGIIAKKGPAFKFQSSRLKLAKVLIKAYISLFQHLPHLIEQRKIIQKQKKISTKAFLKLIKKYRIKLSQITLLD
jgi:GT2 family glycosyltransferase